MDLTDQRLSYEKNDLNESNLPSDGLMLFKQWLQTALDEQVPEPYAMSLATCGRDGQPGVRILLMREITDKGIVFYTNYLSKKGEQISDNPKAEALFFWHELEQQVRIRGRVAKIDADKSDRYFQKRPHDSQVGAWVSQPQSGVVASRQVMEDSFGRLKQQYPEGSTVPTPEFWGGYILYAEQIEFWQGRANRMHDRIVYTLSANDQWQLQRLLP